MAEEEIPSREEAVLYQTERLRYSRKYLPIGKQRDRITQEIHRLKAGLKKPLTRKETK